MLTILDTTICTTSRNETVGLLAQASLIKNKTIAMDSVRKKSF